MMDRDPHLHAGLERIHGCFGSSVPESGPCGIDKVAGFLSTILLERDCSCRVIDAEDPARHLEPAWLAGWCVDWQAEHGEKGGE